MSNDVRTAPMETLTGTPRMVAPPYARNTLRAPRLHCNTHACECRYANVHNNFISCLTAHHSNHHHHHLQSDSLVANNRTNILITHIIISASRAKLFPPSFRAHVIVRAHNLMQIYRFLMMYSILHIRGLEAARRMTLVGG